MSGKYMACVGFYSCTGKAKGIIMYGVDVENRTLRERYETEVDSSSHVIAPSDGKTLYSVVDGGVVSFRIPQNENLIGLSSAPIRGMRDCHLCTGMEDKYVFVSGCHDDKTTVLSLNRDGSVGQIMDGASNKGYGSVAERNFRSHMTYTRRMPDGRYVLSMDNGTDQVKVYRFSDKGKRLFQVDAIHCDLELAPRHFRFSSDGWFFYLMHELQNVTCVYFCGTGDRVPAIRKIRAISTASTRNPSNLMAACAMRLSPNEEYIYCTNADENTVSIYNRDEKSGLLIMIYCLPISEEYPKGVAVFPDQKYTVSINHDSGSISFFEVDCEEGLIVMCEHNVMVNEPNCYAIAKVGDQADKAVGLLIQEDRRQHMTGFILGTILGVTTWGESHGEGIGVVVDGCPVGLPLEEESIQLYLNRRKPGQNKLTTARQEGDQAEILSGVFGGRTAETSIALEVHNADRRSHDYNNIMDAYRPGHADYVFDQKCGFRDYRGGGRSSGRETTAKVMVGVTVCRLLESLGITVRAHTRKMGGVGISRERFDLDEMWNNRLYMPDAQAAARAEIRLEELMAGKDSCRDVMECIIRGVPAEAGGPVLGKLDANLVKAMMSTGTVKGSEIGDGFAASRAWGSENNDGFGISHKTVDSNLHFNDKIRKQTSHSRGTLGGISDGSGIVIRATLKSMLPVGQPQRTVNQKGEETVVEVKSRHNPIIMSGAAAVVGVVAVLTAADMPLLPMTSRLDQVQAFFAQDGV